MNLERYWAKPDKTIQQHINDLLTHLETLKTMGYIDSDDLYELVKQACYYHDMRRCGNTSTECISVTMRQRV